MTSDLPATEDGESRLARVLAATFARKGHQPILPPLVAGDAQEPVRQDAQLEERLDLLDRRNGGTDIIAQTSRPTPAALSPVGHRLAIFDDGAIHIKELR